MHLQLSGILVPVYTCTSIVWEIHLFVIDKISLYFWKTKFHLFYKANPVTLVKPEPKKKLIALKGNFKHSLKNFATHEIQ